MTKQEKTEIRRRLTELGNGDEDNRLLIIQLAGIVIDMLDQCEVVALQRNPDAHLGAVEA